MSFWGFLQKLLQNVDVNHLVAAAENQVTKRVVASILTKIAPPSWLGGPLSWVLGLIVGWIVHQGDLVTYTLGNGWQNTHDGKTFEEAANQRAALQANGASQEEINAAIQAQMDAFDRLFDG